MRCRGSRETADEREWSFAKHPTPPLIRNLFTPYPDRVTRKGALFL